MRILLTKLKHIGDALLLTPTICAIRAHYPDAEIVVVVREGTEEILKGCPAIDRLLTATASEKHRRSGWNWLKDLQLIRDLRRKRFDYAFELSDGDRGRWLCALASVRVRSTNEKWVKLHPLWKKVFKSISTFDWSRRHRVEKDFMAVSHELDIGETPPPLCFERARAEVSPVSEEAGAGCIVFNPAARLPEKLWPEERWIELGRTLISRGSRILINTGPAKDEVALASRIAEAIGPPAFCAKAALRWAQLAHLLYTARYLVTVDTAAMHLAAACQCPTVALFGPLSAGQWKPWRSRSRVLTGLGEWKELRTPDARREKPIHLVTTQAVLAAIEDLEAEARLHGDPRPG